VKTATAKLRKGRKHPTGVRNPRAEWIVKRDTHMALIDPETFRLAQERFADERERNSKPGSGKPGEVFLFSSLVRCKCGGKMTARQVYPCRRVSCPNGCKRPDGKRWQRMCRPLPGSPPVVCGVCGAECPVKVGRPAVMYACRVRSNKGSAACPSSARVSESDLKAMVVGQVLGKVLDPARRPEMEREVERRLNEAMTGGPGGVAKLKAQVAALDAKIRQGAERFLICPPGATAEAAAALARWRGERDVLADRLAEAESAAAQKKNVKRIVRDVMKAVEALEVGLYLDGKRRAESRELYRRLIDRIEVEFEEATVGRRVRSVPTVAKVWFRAEAFEVRNLLAHLNPVVARVCSAQVGERPEPLTGCYPRRG
jgi:hypothetical protein